ncbi:hypothetical protein [Mariprofundus ferrooxydans]|uniref:hypothetical protein n=1 Tax=Mariprofundus ferrooxydans TaxID=314344 RepID=UPI00143106A4|nr:hypothetical protein [Mariprofundus ferrooxydans]
MLIIRGIMWLCLCSQLLWLEGCSGTPHAAKAMNPALRVSLHEVGRVCKPDYNDIPAVQLSFATAELNSSLPATLERAGQLDAGSEVSLDVCIDQLYLRPGLVTLLLFQVAEPDYLVVRARLGRAGRVLHSWRLVAENSAGGSMASPGKTRRAQMLINVITRKLVNRLETAVIRP